MVKKLAHMLMNELSETYMQAYNQAVKYLAVRSHTVFELRNKLARKKFSQGDIAAVLDELTNQKYLDDREFAQAFVQNLIKYKTFGYYGIKNKLRARGIADALAEEILATDLDLEAEKKIAGKAIGKSGKSEPMKLAQMLNRKGFRRQVISEVVGGIFE